VPPTHYKAISQALIHAFATGQYLKDGPPKENEKPAPPNPLTDPGQMEGMMAGMKTQMVMMGPQMVLMGWINFFFQGFVLSACAASAAVAHPDLAQSSCLFR
jgi:ER membrane protein complex subunit 3